MSPMIIKSSLMIFFGFFLQIVLSKYSENLRGQCLQQRNGLSAGIAETFPSSSQFRIVSDDKLMNFTITQEVWETTWVERLENLRELWGRSYTIDNMVSFSGQRKEFEGILFHLRKKFQYGLGETILYTKKHFDPVYNLDAGKYEFSKNDFLVPRSNDYYNHYFSAYDSPLLSRTSNLDGELYYEKYDANGYLTSFRFIYRENMVIKCLTENSSAQRIQATVILVGQLDAQKVCSGKNCLTPKTMNGTENLISKLGEGKIENFYKLDYSRTESKYFLFFDGNLTCEPNDRYFNTCFVISNKTKGEIYLYYANYTSNERAIVTLSKSSSKQTALTISNFTQDNLLYNTVVFIEGDQKPEFKSAKNFEIDAEIFLLYERKELKLNYYYDKMEILEASGIDADRCKQFDSFSTRKYLSQQIIVCEVRNESHTYFIFKVISYPIKIFPDTITV